MTRPVLPRASSGTSGFFFCGMIDEPVQKRSAMSMKPTRGLIQITSSSDMRETCVMISAAAAQNSMAKSRSDTASSELWQTSSKPSVAGHAQAVDREGGAGQRGGAQRQAVDALAAVGHALGVAAEHLDVGQHVVAEGDRLRDLHVGEAGHDGVGMLFGQVESAPARSSRSSAVMSSIAARRYRRMSVATWSLRERPVCSRLPASPTSSVRRFSMFRCTSSRSSSHSKLAGVDFGLDLRHAALDLGEVARR